MAKEKKPPLKAGRIVRPLSLIVQVERILRDAIERGQFPGNRLPTEMELAEQLGASRETVRRAAETLRDTHPASSAPTSICLGTVPQAQLDQAVEWQSPLGPPSGHRQ